MWKLLYLNVSRGRYTKLLESKINPFRDLLFTSDLQMWAKVIADIDPKQSPNGLLPWCYVPVGQISDAI